MRLVQHPGIGVVLAHGLQQLQVAADAMGAKTNRGVAFHLAGHQDDALYVCGTQPGAAGQVVFGDPCLADGLAQCACPIQQRRVEGLGAQDMFQARGARGVVVDTQVVDDPGQRTSLASAQAHRAQETIFDAVDGMGVRGEVFVVLAAPGHHRELFSEGMFGFYEANGRTVKEQLHQGFFPAAEAQHLHSLGQHAAMAALQAEPVDQHFRAARLAALGANIAGVGHKARMDQLRKAYRHASRRCREAVIGQAPTGIEGHAPGVYGNVPQQRIEAQLRGHHVHGAHTRQQLGRVHVARQHLHTGVACECLQVEMALFAAGNDIRVNLEQDGTGGVALQGCIKHRHEVVRAGALQRGITEGLVGDQYAVAWQVEWLDTGVVVLGHPLVLPQLLQRQGPFGFTGGQGRGDQRFKARRCAGIVVNAQVIDDQ
ncbi:hypothetical protein D3C77_337920 [compost metagenome]